MIYDLYTKYINSISTEKIAANFPTVCLMLEEINKLEEGSLVADLGSGISSAVASYNKTCQIISVDDNPEWLVKSENFTREEATDNDKQKFIGWEKFKETDETFDFIFWDLSDIPTRKENLDYITSRLNEGGKILYDDFHINGVRIRTNLAKEKYNLSFVKKSSIDKFGRWSELYLKNGK